MLLSQASTYIVNAWRMTNESEIAISGDPPAVLAAFADTGVSGDVNRPL